MMRHTVVATIAAVVVLCWTGTPESRARDARSPTERRFDVFGSVGRSGFYHGDNSWGGGAVYGGGVAARPFSGALRHLGVEALVLHSGHSARPGSPYETAGNQTSFAVNAAYWLSDSRIQPYFSGGIGAMNADFTLNWISDWLDDTGRHTERASQRVHASKFLVDFGAGLRIRAGSRFFVRPEMRAVTTTPGKGWNFAHLSFSVGVGWAF